MIEELIRHSEEMRRQLSAVMAGPGQPALLSASSFADPGPRPQLEAGAIDLVITANEVNQRHGTGVLLQRIFPDSKGMVAVRSQSHYNGEQDFGEASFCLPRSGLSRPKIFSLIQQWLGRAQVRRVLCVPYYPDDVLVALAAKEIFGAPLCSYIMDDQNITCSGIPDELMLELLNKSSLRLAISPDMRTAYETKYRKKFWLMPPLVAPGLIPASVTSAGGGAEYARTGVLAGNIWGQRWLDLLRKTVRGSGIQIHWYCNAGSSPSWLKFDRKELEEDGITIFDPLPEDEMARVLRRHPFAVLPSGTLDKADDNSSVAQLSLPTRVPFILASSNTPILVMGNQKVAAARFVRRFQLGEVCEYETASFLQAVQRLTERESQATFRHNACQMAKGFSAEGAADWIWDSLRKGEAADLRFETLIPPGREFAYYVEAPLPAGIYDDFAPTYSALRRLKAKGFDPDFVVDIGASTGVWSHYVDLLFPRARFLLIDPIASKYDKDSTEFHTKPHKNFESIEVAVADKPGKTRFRVSANLYGSSMLAFDEELIEVADEVDVEVTTLDLLAKRKKVQGRGLVKMDVQCAEHLIIEGGREFLTQQADAVIIELSLYRYSQNSKTFLEMLNLMDSLGFRYYDDAGDWRAASDGVLMQKDGLFLRRELYPDKGSL